MAWLNQFLLGRPGFESSFDYNAETFSPAWARTSSDNYTLTGDLKERVLRTYRPTIGLKSGWFPKTQLDLFVSMLTITDTFLSFIPRTSDWNIYKEPNVAPTTTTVQIQNSSATKLSAIYALGGYGSTPTQGTITINHVWDNPAGNGTDYYEGGGTYADATRTLTLQTPLPQTEQVYIDYSFPGWLVRLKKLTTPITGGRVDNFTYDFSLDGV